MIKKIIFNEKKSEKQKNRAQLIKKIYKNKKACTRG